MSKHVIFGDVKTSEVWIDGKPLDPSQSLALENKSPSGFSWGYYGSGPAQLSLAILLEFCDQATSLRLYQQFKVDIIATQNMNNDLVLPIEAVREWIAAQHVNQEEEKTA